MILQRAEIIVVCGPPASGKTTYVREHMKDGDLVWDFDEVMRAITGNSICEPPEGAKAFVLAMRQTFCSKAVSGKAVIKRVWVIVTDRCGLTSDLKAAGAQIIDMATPREVCIERLNARGASGIRVANEYFARNPS